MDIQFDPKEEMQKLSNEEMQSQNGYQKIYTNNFIEAA